MTVTINGTTGIANDGGYTGDGVVFADTTPANTLVTTTGGNVGIGTSSPLSTAMLEVSRSTTVIPTATVTADAQVVGWRFRRTGGSYPREYYIGLRENSTAWDFYDNTADALRMRIDSSGNLLVGTTSVLGKQTNAYDGATAFGLALANTAGGTAGQIAIRFMRNGSDVGSVTTTNTATAYNTSSDYRLKEQVQPMTGALSVVQQLKPCTYKWKVDGSDGEGFIAHELAEVVPQCVTGEKDAVDDEGNPVYQGIDTSFLVATLTAAIQELKAIVDAQGAEIAALKGQP